MKKLIIMLFVVMAVALIAAPAVKIDNMKAVSKVNVRHRDPGCHWYVKANSTKYLKRLRIRGPVKLMNQDIATQIIKGPAGTQRVKPGKSIVLRHKGTYRETMVRQMKMDNHLTLVIR